VGWRDQEHALTRPAGTVRLLGLGDSYLWGQGVHREDVVLNRLARLLEEAHPGVPVESINTARMGSNTVDQLALLVNRGLDYQPHLVIVHFVPNDVEPDLSAQGPKLEFFREYTALYQTPDRLSEHSRLWGWLRQRAAGALRARRYVREAVASFRPENPGWRRARQALLGIRDACDRGGADLLLVIFPFFHELDGDYPFQGIHDTVRRHAETQGIAVLDLRDRYRTFRGPELWVHPTDQHPNELAHALAARAIAEYLAERAEAFPVLTAAWRAP
jgi:lysophospholipase L1-like esterase